MTEKTETRFPLFYRQPELLTAAQHVDLRLRPGGYGFAKEANAIPLTVVEFGPAMRHYPVVFAAGDGFPVAILGLDRRNGFVDGKEWAPGCYVPAYARRYPFVFVDRSQDSFVLAIDRAAPHFTGDAEGAALFSDGRPTEVVDNILTFCRDFHGAHIQTDAFVEALLAQELLVDQHADARLDSGQALTLSGFKVVDRAKFDALPDALVLEWHRKGWLALVHFHFLSLDRFADLLARAEDAVVSAEAVTETEDA
ncbi:MAG: SapC family protein [Sphingopyxis sp.]|uniref:SapC family protein n=1 Tax=Sphingopyxis sp. TaxID=1908224 RepID=UPI001A1FBA69|nr:SapC family protein [Sphingopyxis sp.]MBJ7498641.1 SapC family protein [Sphingopyxis sp.]